MKKQVWLSFIPFAFSGFLCAQEAMPFVTQNEFYIYGDATVIGNNTLSKDIEQPFNDISLTNDDIDMVFVDVDNDDSTFSSSSATLELPKNHKKIVYAALYWSGTYSYEQGYRRESNGQFYFQGKRIKKRNAISKVKLKLPNGSYKNISGNIIFDGARHSSFALNSPYACSADVTKLLKNAEQANGEYTVANVMASKGFVSGGSAAGWLLYVVYEAPREHPVYITTYNGFAHVGTKPVTLKFKNFKTLEQGEVKTSLTLAALEGDSALTEDECIIANPTLKRALILNDNIRPRNNFFNSKITIDETEFNKRHPFSENTLGFDVAELKIPEASQPIIANNSTEVELAFNSKLDRFYLFFTAFQTEISKVFYEEKTNLIPISINEEVPAIKTSSIQLKAPKKEIVIAIPEKKSEITPKTVEEKQIIEQPIIVTAKPKQELIPIKNKVVKEGVLPTEASVITTSKIKSKEVKKEENEALVGVKPLINSVEKPVEKLPIWLDKKQVDETVIYQPTISQVNQGYLSNSLALNRENYKQLLTKEDYVYETQTFKRVLNQEPTLIEGLDRGYYIIATLLTNLDEAIIYQNKLKGLGVNSKMFKDVKTEKHYVYLYNSENFYDVFMLRKAFIKSVFLQDVWILNINIDSGLKNKM